MSALALYSPPPSIALARAQRGYTSLQLEAHQQALERAARMNPPPEIAPAAPIASPCAKPFPFTPLERWKMRTPAYLIKREVAEEFEISVTVLLSALRTSRILIPRMTAMWLHRKLLPKDSLITIGHSFANFGGRERDHSTIFNALQVVENKLAADPDYAARVERLRSEISVLLAEKMKRPGYDPHATGADHAFGEVSPGRAFSDGEHTPMSHST